MGDASGARRSLFLAVQSSKREGECTSEGGRRYYNTDAPYNLHGIDHDNEACIGDDFGATARVRRTLGRVNKHCRTMNRVIAQRLVMTLLEENTG